MVRSKRPHAQQQPLIVGRDAERRQLRDLFDQAVAGHGSLALVTGEAGIGKTTLVGELSKHVSGDGALVLQGYCYDLTMTPPYGPWIEITHSPVPSDLPQLPGEIRSGNSLAGVDSKEALFDLMLGFLQSLANERPLILVLEDMHWADSASLEFLRFFARQLENMPALLVVTWRDDEITRRHELYQLLPALMREAPAERIRLQRLDDDAIASLVAQLYELNAYDELRLVRYLQRLGEGNPFFIGELLHALQDRRQIRREDGRWALDTLDESQLPSMVRQVIDARLDRLEPETLRDLQLASIIGQDIPVDLWSRLSGQQDADFDAAVEEALDAHLLIPSAAGETFSFSHALVREALYEQVMPARRRSYHRRIGEALAELPRPIPDSVAHHFQQAGDPRAFEWHIRAGYRAEHGYAWAMASRAYEAALPYLEVDSSRLIERGWLLHHIGQLMSMYRTVQAAAYVEDALQIGRETGDRALEAFALADLGISHGFGKQPGGIRLAVAELEQGVAALEELSETEVAQAVRALSDLFAGVPRYARLDMDIQVEIDLRRWALSRWMSHVGRYRESIELGQTTLSFDRDPGSQPQQSRGIHRAPMYGLAASYAALGQLDEARQAFAMTREIAKNSGNYAVHVSAGITEFRTLIVPFDGGTSRIRRQALDQLVEDSDRASGVLRVSIVEQNLMRELRFPEEVYQRYLDGDWESARTLAVAQVAEFPGQRFKRSVYYQALLAWQQGDLDLAWHNIFEIHPQGTETIPGDGNLFIGNGAQRVAAELALDAGDVDLARSWIRAHERWIEWSGSVLGRSEGALLRARLHRESGDTKHARRHGGRAVSLAADPRQPLALMAAQRFLGRLATDGGRFERAEEFLEQSLALATGCEIPHQRAETLLAFAELRAEQGRRAEARSLLEDIRTICEPMGATLLLSQVRALENVLDSNQPPASYPGGLSPREAEVLVLVARGMTNAEVGRQLFISPRTVGHHLQSIYGKLGVTSRAAASSFAVEHGLATALTDG